MPVNSFDDYYMSWKPSKSKLSKPIYLSLAQQMEEEILCGNLKPGTMLPPQRELADFLDISFTTVTRAYNINIKKGLLYTVVGKGTFVTSHGAKNVIISQFGLPPDGIDFGSVTSFQQTDYLVKDAMEKVAQSQSFYDIIDYKNASGAPEHKAAGLEWLRRFGVLASPKNMVITLGAQNALTIILTALFNPGDTIACDKFTFSNIIVTAKILHLKLVSVDSDDDGMLPEELEKHCNKKNVRGVFLMPSCTNPTTVMMSESRKKEIADIVRKHNLLVIEDELYAFTVAGIVPQYKTCFFNMLPNNTVYISSASKPICTGLHIAYLVFPEIFAEKIRTTLFITNVKTPGILAQVTSELITSGKADAILDIKRALAKEANEIFDRQFPSVPKTNHPAPWFRWLPINPVPDSQKLEAELLKYGVRVFHSSRFLCGEDGVGNQYLRISLVSTDNFNQLTMGFEILHNQLKQKDLLSE